jgi:hypothetical protein
MVELSRDLSANADSLEVYSGDENEPKSRTDAQIKQEVCKGAGRGLAK